jgi:hypothetical protein
MTRGTRATAYARSCRGELSSAQSTVLGLPFCDCGETVSHEQSAPRCSCEPRRDTRSLGISGFDDLGVDIRVHGNGKLDCGVPSWHPKR